MVIEYQHSCAESGFPCTVCKMESGLVEWNVRNVDDGIEGDLALLVAIYSQRPEMECTVMLNGTCFV